MTGGLPAGIDKRYPPKQKITPLIKLASAIAISHICSLNSLLLFFLSLKILLIAQGAVIKEVQADHQVKDQSQ